MEGLNERQELFCQYYTQVGDTFGNGAWSYAQAYSYELDSYSRDDAVYKTTTDEKGKTHSEKILKSSYDKAHLACSVGASKLLRLPKIALRIQKLRAEKMTVEFADSELMKVMSQDEDRAPKVAAIREFNLLNNRVTKRMDITSGGEPILRNLTDDELATITAGSDEGVGA